ncbi:hypothetical protein BUALT_Bualt04G0048200 [Buddleja alternifolia]|uniref:Myb/SANT-like domain-containing protein n=1 Tax=Buddleja alternifolia TaxID=168488 RepID=A0AAV6XMQ7_9LAMI|nr:hypothetical protein BUALT_Bualt04G0048200 [Buddleja alternifolia]
MNFVYMLPGWEGSAADGRVLRDAVSRANGLKVPTGQYYLCDNGYMNCPGFLAPYRGVRKPVVCRRMWTRLEENALVQAMKEILSSGWKADNGFRVGYLNVLQDKIMKVFSTTDLRAQPHISSKMQAWKKQYNTLYVIFGASGVGWNSTTKMIETDSDEQWEAACKTEPTAGAMQWKSWPYYDSWCEIFGKDRANGNGAEDFHDAFVGVIYKETETQPQSPPATNLEDIDTPDSLLAEEVATTPVCEPGSSTTTKPASKGKRKLSEGIVGPIMEGLNNFTEKTDSRLGDIIGKMGHEQELTRKCESVSHIVNEIPTNMIVKNMQVLLAMFFSLPRRLKWVK